MNPEPRSIAATNIEGTSKTSPHTVLWTSDRDKLLWYISSLAVIRKPLSLSSGQETGIYVDLRQITLHHATTKLVGQLMFEEVQDLVFDAVGGLTMGADPIAMAMMYAAAYNFRALDTFVVRKEKKTHGLQRLVEGPYVVGRRVLVVEDVSTTGSSILQAVNGLNDAGAIIVGAAILLDRGGQKIVEATGLPCRSLYNLEDILRTGPYVDSV